MQHPDEGLIHAWLDGALAADDAAQLESHVASCTSCGALVAEARGLIAASSRIVGHLDAVPRGVIPAVRKKNPWLRSAWPSAIAATLIIGVGMFATREESVRTTETIAPLAAPPVPVEASAAAATDQAVQPPVTRPSQRMAASAPIAAKADSVVMPPPTAALQKAEEVTQTSPTTTLRTAERPALAVADSARRERSRLEAVVVTGASAGAASTAPAMAAPPQRMSRQASMADQAAVEASAAFAGCYEMTTSTDILPARFALSGDSVGPGVLAVRYLDAEGRPSERIVDASWATEGGRAVVRTAGRGAVLILVKAGSGVVATSPNGPRNGRVIRCGERE